MKINANTNIYITDCKREYRLSFCNSSIFRRERKKVEEELRFDEDGVLIETERMKKSRADSERRARVALVDLALCNDFEYFGTITFSDKKVNCADYFSLLRKVVRSFNNYQQRESSNFKYILVPELGEKTYRFHFHFLISGISPDSLFYNKYGYLDWHLIADNFGYCQITRIQDSDGDRRRVAFYCSKYISKGNIKLLNHRYFCSKGLNKPKKTMLNGAFLCFPVRDWLELNGFVAYSNTRFNLSFSIPSFVFKDLNKWLFLKKWNIVGKKYDISFSLFDGNSPFDSEQLSICIE